MRFVIAVIALMFASACVAQEHGKAPAKKDVTQPEKLLYNHLLQECQKHFDARKKEVAALKTPADIKARQARLKAKFIEALGGFPKKTPLHPQVTGKIDKGDYRIEKVIYESQPNHHVTAILYLPKKGQAPYPGVLLPCGHSSNGKAAEAYQRACISLAKNGFVVLCYDPIGQGERIQLLDKNGKPAIPGSTTEHTMVGVGALLVGKSAATYHIWDGIRSLDYLESRPEVDPKRLGCTGNSGGGTLTAYLMALDDRIVCAAPSCYITSLERLFKTIGPQDAEQNITGQVAFGMDHADFLTMRAPLPTLVCCGTKDFFDIDGTWASFREAKLIYSALGFGERISLFEYNDKHGFSKPRRQAVVQWMKRWLQKFDEPFVEEDFPVFTDAELQCTRTGQVLSDFNGKSVFDLNAELAKELKEGREKWQDEKSAANLREKIMELISRPNYLGKFDEKILTQMGFDFVATTKAKGCKFDDVLCSRPPFHWISVVPEKIKKGNPFIISINEYSVDDAKKGGALEKLGSGGQVAFVLDVRGIGRTKPNSKGGMVKYFGSDWQETFLSLHLQRPLLGQRVDDVSFQASYISGEAKDGILLSAKGIAGPIALHAAVLDPRVTHVTIENGVTCWEDVVQTPISVNQLSNVVPGALAYYDLPQLAALLAPRPLTIRGALDPAGNTVSQAHLEKVYAKARAAYKQANAEKNLVLEAAK
jgi:cephalosporin-C deacetylase-like acetyl esterase